jgi:hypothetical protein
MTGLWKCRTRDSGFANDSEDKIKEWRKKLNHEKTEYIKDLYYSIALVVLMIICAIVVVAGQLGTYGANTNTIVGIFFTITCISFSGTVFRICNPGEANIFYRFGNKYQQCGTEFTDQYGNKSNSLPATKQAALHAKARRRLVTLEAINNQINTN